MYLATLQFSSVACARCVRRYLSGTGIYVLGAAFALLSQLSSAAVLSGIEMKSNAVVVTAHGNNSAPKSRELPAEERVSPQFLLAFTTLTISGLPGVVTPVKTTPTPTSSQVNALASFTATFTTTHDSPASASITFSADGVIIAGCAESPTVVVSLGDKQGSQATCNTSALLPGVRIITAFALAGNSGSKWIDRFAAPNEALTHTVLGAPPTIATLSAFTLTPVRDAEPSKEVVLYLRSVAGLNVAAPISINGADGAFSVRCRGIYTTQPQVIFNDDSVCVRITSGAANGETVSTVLTIGGVSATFSVTTIDPVADDTVPLAFSFPPISGTSPGEMNLSVPIIVSGINKPAPISISSVGSTAAAYSVGCNQVFNAAPSTVVNGDTVCIRLAASQEEGGSASATLSIGGVAGLFNLRNYPAMPVNRYRISMPSTRGHLLTTDENEYNFLIKNYPQEFLDEGVDHKIYRGVATADGQTTVPYYRLYLRAVAQHFWTTDANEYAVLRADSGNVLDEGIDGNVFLRAGVAGTVPLYRMVLAGTAVHHWTTDANEFKVLTASGAWLAEGAVGNALGVTGYVWPR